MWTLNVNAECECSGWLNGIQEPIFFFQLIKSNFGYQGYLRMDWVTYWLDEVWLILNDFLPFHAKNLSFNGCKLRIEERGLTPDGTLFCFLLHDFFIIWRQRRIYYRKIWVQTTKKFILIIQPHIVSELICGFSKLATCITLTGYQLQIYHKEILNEIFKQIIQTNKKIIAKTVW